MSPLNCPKFIRDYDSRFARYNACLDCGYRHKGKVTSSDECWFHLPLAIKLADILTVPERVAILEDREEVPPVNIAVMTHRDYQQLQRLILTLQEKLESHIDKSSKKKKYNKYD